MLRRRIRRTIAITAALILAAVINTVSGRAESQVAAAQKKGSSQGLWLAELGRLAEFQGQSLKKSGKPSPTLVLGVAPSDLAFDKAGNLWLAFLADPAGGQLGELTPNELKPGNGRRPFRVNISYLAMDGGPIQDPTSLAFDPAGDLWVAVPTKGNVVEYTPDQLLAGGSPTPAATLHFSDDASTQPAVVRFDSAGDLWLAYPFLPSSPQATAVEFTAALVAEIQMGGSPAPTLTVQAGSDLATIDAIAFDAQSNLWIAASTFTQDPNGVDGGSVEMFSVAGKAGMLSQPDVTITPTAISSINQSLDHPSGLAFDHQGSLWVSSRTSSDQVSGGGNSAGFIVKFSASQLAASGTPLPPTIISPSRKGSNLKNPGPIVFGPTVK